MAGIQTCRDACDGAGFAYFGFECPRDVGGVLTVHCECGNHDGSLAVVGNENCRQYNAAIDPSLSPCQGGPDGYFMITGSLGIYDLGAHGFTSAYRTLGNQYLLTIFGRN